MGCGQQFQAHMHMYQYISSPAKPHASAKPHDILLVGFSWHFLASRSLGVSGAASWGREKRCQTMDDTNGFVSLRQLVPGGFEALGMAAPRREELDEDLFALSHLLGAMQRGSVDVKAPRNCFF